jgi:phosphotransferase system enzyme I (PtsP)
LTLCGEIGGKPLEAMVLLALGYRGLAMSAASIGPVKAMVLATNLGEAEDFVATLMKEATGGQSLRDKLRKFAKAQGIPV